jgi:hypothetical protein
VPANIVTVAPYTLQWNTAGLTNIVHLVGVRVTDAAGATADSSSLSLTVDKHGADGHGDHAGAECPVQRPDAVLCQRL